MEVHAALHGTWYVVLTDLPLWRTRDNPSVTYAPLPDGRVLDAVRFTRRGKPGLILGVDTPQPDGSLIWRGVTPLTRWTPSRWRVLHAGPEWAVTAFGRTLFTPAGLDVYARRPSPSAAQEAEVRAFLGGHPLGRAHLPGLFAPRHGPG